MILKNREAINIILWAIFSIALLVTFLWHVYLAWWWQYVLAGIIAILAGKVITMTINAWIFNWAFKKFFDKWFKE